MNVVDITDAGYPASYSGAAAQSPGTGAEVSPMRTLPEDVRPAAIRVLLVDDQQHVLDSMKINLEMEGDMLVVGQADDGESGVALAHQVYPDVIVMDVMLPDISGIEATARLSAGAGPVCVVMLSMYDDKVTRSRAMAAGAADFVGKYEPVENVVEAIRRVSGRAA
jgi:two-component system, NarL family, invasion response regulator UvrY